MRWEQSFCYVVWLDLFMLKVYVGTIESFRDPKFFSAGLSRLREERQKRILSFHSPDDRCRGLVAGLLLRRALYDAGISYERAIFAEAEGGKPYLCDSSLFFNLSHAGECAICAVSHQEVGADVESLTRFAGEAVRIQRLAEKIMTETEMQDWKRESSGESLVRLWTKKESYVKLSGAGLRCDFGKIETKSAAFYQGRELLEQYYGCVCTKEPEDAAEWIVIDNLEAEYV